MQNKNNLLGIDRPKGINRIAVVRIPEETISLIKERLRIEDVAGRYIPSLSKKGKNYMGLCPFHKEKTPSFSVSPEKQTFYCFGCGTAGNVFTLIGKLENTGFAESVKIAGAIAGISVSEEKNEAAEEHELMQRINAYGAEVYHKYLLSSGGAAAMSYLKERGVSKQAVRDFRLGFAPNEWTFLTDLLKRKGVSLDTAKKCGLLSSGKDGKQRFDMFRNRIIFPICDTAGHVIAFGGRVTDNALPKYINSPESPLFSKRRTLYGFNRARASISDVKRAIVVEGYLDVIGCHQAGIENVVAPLGTSLTEEQVRILARYCTELVLLFDGDAAGANASLKALETAKNVSVDIKVAALPNTDPFEFIVSNDARRFMAVVDKAKNPVDFLIDRVISEKAAAGTSQSLIKLFDIIKTVDMESRRGEYLKRISFLLELDENAVRRDFGSYISKRTGPADMLSLVKTDISEQTDYMTRCTREIVKFLCKYPSFTGKASLDFPLAEIRDNVSFNILKKIYEMYSEDENFNPNKLFDFFDGGLELTFLSGIFSQDNNFEEPDAAYDEIYLNMKLYIIKRKLRELIELVKKNPDNKSGYLTEIEILSMEKEKLSKYIHNPKQRGIFQ